MDESQKLGMVTAAELAAMVFDPVTVAELLELVDTEQCDPACLLARDDAGCDCRCGGKWHGYARSSAAG